MDKSDEGESVTRRLKGILSGVLFASIPDHPANGGLTGDQEWRPGEQTDEAADDDAACR
ncbi:hypothetical protein [Halovenus marina]|uniref:hypothetical protein n=1 Tax=Halovenus marina TaxID=3396621 RepID=UPI003F543F90